MKKYRVTVEFTVLAPDAQSAEQAVQRSGLNDLNWQDIGPDGAEIVQVVVSNTEPEKES